MTYHVRPAKRSEAKPLIGIYSESGCGKTWSSLMLARGFVGQGQIVMIETEGGRGEAFADLLPGGYSVIPMREEFSPRNYGEAISAAELAKPAALIIDSASHEWEGSGGVLSMAAQNQQQGKKGPMVWQTPKMDHQRHFMLRLLATPIPLVIVCMRAKYPMEERVVGNSKEWARSTKLDPKQADDILYEMFIHGWIDQDHRFQGTKYTRPDLIPILPSGQPISIATGVALAAWAKGEAGSPVIPLAERAPATAAPESTGGSAPPVLQPNGKPVELIDRAVMMGKITGASARAKLSAKRRVELNREHLRGASMESADPAALQDLLDAIRAEAPEPVSESA